MTSYVLFAGASTVSECYEDSRPEVTWTLSNKGRRMLDFYYLKCSLEALGEFNVLFRCVVLRLALLSIPCLVLGFSLLVAGTIDVAVS